MACCPANRIWPLMVPTVLRPASTSAQHKRSQRQVPQQLPLGAPSRAPSRLACSAAVRTQSASMLAAPCVSSMKCDTRQRERRAPSRVVLDEPLGPISADRWPGGRNPDTSVSSLSFCFLLALFQTV